MLSINTSVERKKYLRGRGTGTLTRHNVYGSHSSEEIWDNFVTTFSYFFSIWISVPISLFVPNRSAFHRYLLSSSLLIWWFKCVLHSSATTAPDPWSLPVPLVELPPPRRLEGSRHWRNTYQSSEWLGQESRMGIVAQITRILSSYLSFYYFFVVVPHWRIYRLDFDEKDCWGLFTPLVTLIF